MFPSQWKKYKFKFESYVINVISSSMGYLHSVHVKSRVNVTWMKDFIILLQVKQGDFFVSFCTYFSQHCFICRPSDSTVSEDAGLELRTVATSASAVRRSNQSGRSHSHSARAHPHSVKGTKAWDFSLNLCPLHVHLYSIRKYCETGRDSVRMKVKSQNTDKKLVTLFLTK
jgi:hypothetical protein